MSDTPVNANDTTPIAADPLGKDSTESFPASSMSTEAMIRAFIQVQHARALQSASRNARLQSAAPRPLVHRSFSSRGTVHHLDERCPDILRHQGGLASCRQDPCSRLPNS
ncbi:hypothetical protein PSTG_19014 [Puccinia striiformis f. sp. tritici PST-78]|uniref:Uncharacterized protein n=1 Tax=Puccinia striiformis f. sp. tritici PST-78 TaxID=1165861 RepID=A0A0L0UKY1_9BASI|nr:hypothetical protein PSTG_19014 [Puccinia striiformis f. sp. tritici PST-78]